MHEGVRKTSTYIREKCCIKITTQNKALKSDTHTETSSLHFTVSYLNLLSKKPLCCLSSHVLDKERESKFSPVACKENIKHTLDLYVCVSKCFICAVVSSDLTVNTQLDLTFTWGHAERECVHKHAPNTWHLSRVGYSVCCAVLQGVSLHKRGRRGGTWSESVYLYVRMQHL